MIEIKLFVNFLQGNVENIIAKFQLTRTIFSDVALSLGLELWPSLNMDIQNCAKALTEKDREMKQILCINPLHNKPNF